MGSPDDHRVLGDRFELRGVLGRGGMATVHLAWDRVREQEVALKLLHPHLVERPSMRARLRREVQAAARLRHPHALVGSELHELGDQLAISMPVHRGRTLAAVVEEDGPLAPDALRRLLLQVGGALAEAHRQGIVHRDISPGNILVDPAGDAVLMDFGLARLADSQTLTTKVMGTVGYTAPERYEGRPADARSDLYGLGAVAWHAATGKAPFDADNPMATLRLQVQGGARLAEVAPGQVELAPLVDALLRPDPAGRPQGADEVLAALGGGALVVPAEPGAPTSRLQRGLGWSTVACIALSFLQDCGGFALGGIVDHQAIPEPDTFAVAMGVSIFIGLPLVTIPTLVAGLRTPEGDPRSAPTRAWAGLLTMMLLTLAYGLFAGVIGPNLGWPEEARILALVGGHMAVLIPVAVGIGVSTRFFGLARSGGQAAAAPKSLADRATDQLDALERALATAPAAVRADLRELLRDLRERVDSQAEALAVADAELASRAPDEAEIDRLASRLERMGALGQDDPDLRRSLEARQAAQEAVEELERTRTRAAARLVQIAAAAQRARGALRESSAPQTVSDLVGELDDRSKAAVAARQEVEP